LTSYAAFAALAFFGGAIYNRVGIKICLMIGGFGYVCLASAYFTTAHIGNRATPWVVLAGCLEGLSAAMVSPEQLFYSPNIHADDF
jgi:MFS family permease